MIFDSPIHPSGGTYFDTAYFVDDVASVSAPATVTSGETVTVTVSNFADPITSATFAGIDVSASISQTGDDVTIDVPEAFANGLPFESLPIEVSDGTDTASTSTTLEPDATIRFNGLVAGYEGEDWTDENVFTTFEDDSIAVQDGWHYTVRDPEEIIETFNDDGTYESSVGDFFVRVFDETDTTDSDYGTWTEEATITSEEQADDHELSVINVSSTTEVSQPTLTVVYHFNAEGAASQSETNIPEMVEKFIYSLFTESVSSETTVSSPQIIDASQSLNSAIKNRKIQLLENPATVYLQRDNTIVLELRQNGSPIEENILTNASLWIPSNAFNDGVSKTLDINSGNLSLIDNETKISLKLGLLDMKVGQYKCYLTVFDALNTNGIAWDTINLNVRSWRV